MKRPTIDTLENWSADYSEPGFWSKVRNRTRAIGRRPVEMGLTLFYTLREPSTPIWCKAVISGSLGYFISMVDAVPDLTPVLGYTDDIYVMAAALAALGVHITPRARQKAHDTARRLIRDDAPARKPE
ncbi:hypothetical protein RE428_17760 [Marinobacter nanhaiticus D15-8W]|uniref:DUF1232 domain-containing protein n=1 Tax=Marinobacter nanhaiticus D15-8W TaxID=626887 RepID=N6WPA5_9GAMM|nr:YkvA family protein [Marinobacter nanhaiticus]ENO13391.1 DUF1232 domain-containing protein [Marinobacter nanhaiticus D15-8W]BES70758.1 hypothetical protein RE428_17760 [Marinobacter nanhaiticus D15-8W]